MRCTALQPQIGELKSALQHRSAELGKSVAEEICREVDFYARPGGVSKAELIHRRTDILRQIFDGLDGLDEFDTSWAARTGATRARAGVPLPAGTQAYRIGVLPMAVNTRVRRGARPGVWAMGASSPREYPRMTTAYTLEG